MLLWYDRYKEQQRGHEISKNAGRTKKDIENKVNSLLMGNCSVKRRATGESKAIRGFRTGGSVPGKGSGDSEMVPYRVWKMLSLDAQTLIRSGKEGKIGLAAESGVKAGGQGGGEMSKTNKNRRNRLLRLCTVDGKQNPAAAKDLDDLLASVGDS